MVGQFPIIILIQIDNYNTLKPIRTLFAQRPLTISCLKFVFQLQRIDLTQESILGEDVKKTVIAQKTAIDYCLYVAKKMDIPLYLKPPSTCADKIKVFLLFSRIGFFGSEQALI